MEGIIKVSTEQLISTAGEFSNKGTAIENITTEMMNLVSGLSGAWEGDAATGYMTRFRGLEDDIRKVIRMVQEHATDLESMAQEYQTAEQQNAETAESLPNDVIV